MLMDIAARARRREILRSTAFVVGIAIMALGVAVPGALGEGRLAGSTQGSGPSPSYLGADAGAPRAAAAFAADRRTDAFDREAVVPQVALYVDANERGRGPAPAVGSTVSSGRDVDWPQLAIGFLFGVALALGLVLAYRSTRQRALAH